MDLNRWQNVSPALLRTLEDLRSEFQQALGNAPSPGNWSPAVDVFETSTELVIQADLPGVKQEDLRVQVEGAELVIAGERRFQEPEEARTHRIERTYGTFQRGFQLPGNVDRDRIRAALKEGVLTVRLPKVELAKPRAIQVDVES